MDITEVREDLNRYMEKIDNVSNELLETAMMQVIGSLKLLESYILEEGECK